MAEDFAPSKLGTKAHWDSVYKEEVDNFEELGDEGEVWFGTETVEKMVEWTQEHVPTSPAPYILDIGTGNGVMLFSLAEEGYDAARMLGVDYSEDSVRLAKLVADARERSDVTFAQGDFLKDDPPHVQGMEDGKVDVWDLLLDKGTYDAIGLAGKDEDGVRPRDVYPGRVIGKTRSSYVITRGNELHRPRDACKKSDTRLFLPTRPLSRECPHTPGALRRTMTATCSTSIVVVVRPTARTSVLPCAIICLRSPFDVVQLP